MEDATMENIFNKTRIKWDLYVIALFFYFPIGVSLAFIRFFIGFHAFLISLIFGSFPVIRSYVLRVMCAVLGFVVIQHHSERSKEETKVIVTNHITNFDHMAIKLVKPCIVPSVWDLPSTLIWILGYNDFKVAQGRPVFMEYVKNFIKDSKLPLLVFPEGATTNGKVGLLKFNAWPFSLNESVQPIALEILQPPLIRVSASVLASRWWSDMFWHLFVPYTVFILRYLPVMAKHDKESDGEFAIRVQQRICQELTLQHTDITSYQKVEYAKSLCNDEMQSKKQL